MGKKIFLRTVRSNDFDRLLSLWNTTNNYDPIDRLALKRKVFLDVNFDPDGFIIADDKEKLWGFVYAIRRLVPIDAGGGLESEKAWINAFGLMPDAPEEVGERLILAAEEFALKNGAKSMIATSYTPNYFTQGIDAERYPRYAALLDRLGYTSSPPSYSMDLDLANYMYSEKTKLQKERLESEGYVFCCMNDQLLQVLFAYLSKFIAPGWTCRIRKLLIDNDDYNRIHVVLYQDEVIGFNVFGDPDGSPERFGPFGVRDDFRGKGIGRVLLEECLIQMKSRGLHNAWMQWASGDVAPLLYSKIGFTRSRGFIIYSKQFTCK